MLKSERQPTIRLELMRVLGVLGALEPATQRKTALKLQRDAARATNSQPTVDSAPSLLSSQVNSWGTTRHLCHMVHGIRLGASTAGAPLPPWVYSFYRWFSQTFETPCTCVGSALTSLGAVHTRVSTSVIPCGGKLPCHLMTFHSGSEGIFSHKKCGLCSGAPAPIAPFVKMRRVSRVSAAQLLLSLGTFLCSPPLG